jgi:hypothetical protein
MTKGSRAAWFIALGILTPACDEQQPSGSELRPEGPPEVVAIIGEAFLGPEGALYCKYVSGQLDELAPREIDGMPFCPLTEAEMTEVEGLDPLGWGLRIVFDELLAGEAVETLDCDLDDCPLVAEPVALECNGVPVPTEGYYVPNGNKESFPVGPSIQVIPDSPFTFPTGSECTIQLGDVIVDESGEPVPADQTSYTFEIAELALVEAIPSDGAVLDADGAATFVFNANLDPIAVDITDVEVLGGDGLPIFDYDMTIVGHSSTADAIEIHSILPDGFAPGQYTARVKAGVMLGEVNGGTTILDAPVEIHFSVE